MIKKLLFVAVMIVFNVFANAGQAQTVRKSAEQSSISILNGGWMRVAINLDGKPLTGITPQFRVFNDGYFSMIGQDTTGAWTTTYAGTYEIDGNLYKEKMLYSSNVKTIGVIQWQEFEIKGDTLIFQTNKKVIDAKGEDVTASMHKREIKCVRANKIIN